MDKSWSHYNLKPEWERNEVRIFVQATKTSTNTYTCIYYFDFLVTLYKLLSEALHINEIPTYKNDG